MVETLKIFLFLLVTLQTCISGQNDISEDRLLLAIQEPVVLSFNPDGSQSTITVGFTSGPNPPRMTFSVKCVPAGEKCDYPASGEGAVTGPLSSGRSSLNVTVTQLESGASYTCYAAASLGKWNQCKPATPNVITLPSFYRSANGVTILCPNAAVGDTGIVDGVEYTYRDEAGLRELASNVTAWDLLTTTCTSGVTDLSSLFDDDSQFPGFFDNFNIDVSTWDTRSVDDMDSMFDGAGSFNQPLGDWDTSNVKSLRGMFRDAVSFDQSISGWDTSNVKDMDSMFAGALFFNQSIAGWDTSNVKDMDSMFNGATSFNQYIGDWDTQNVEDMDSMFNGATSFNQYIGDWDTRSVKDMHGMFAGAISFNQPLDDWDTSNVEDMDSMFKGAIGFDQPLGRWNTSRVTDMDSMFEGAAIFNQNLTTWDVTLVASCFRFAQGATSWQDPLKPSLTCEQCFPADAVVYTHDRGPMQIQHVRIGDRLLTYSDAGQAIYDDVYMIGHKDAMSFAVFISITTSNNRTIRLTPDHHIFVVRNQTMEEIPSQNVEVGDGLVVDHGDVVSVVAISRVRSQGLFNPYTKSGRIVVDGILASCHSSSMLDGLFRRLGIPLSTGYQVAFAPIRFLYTIVGPRVFLRFEWILDEAAAIFNSGSYQDLIRMGHNIAVTSMLCIVTASSLAALSS